MKENNILAAQIVLDLAYTIRKENPSEDIRGFPTTANIRQHPPTIPPHAWLWVSAYSNISQHLPTSGNHHLRQIYAWHQSDSGPMDGGPRCV